MVRLRTSNGIDTTLIAKHYGDQATTHLLQQAQQFINQGLLELHDNTLVLNSHGVMLSDNIIRELMWEE